jgi:hypothetical protein
MTIRTLSVALLSALALVGAGCAGGDDEAEPTNAEFEQSVNSTVDRVNFALGRITAATSEDELLNRMDEAAAAIDGAASDLEDAGAPEFFADEAEQLSSSLHQLSVDLSAVASDVRNEIVEAPAGLNFESWDQANLALAAMIGDGLNVKTIQRQ